MDPLGPGRIFWAVFPGNRGDGKQRPMVVLSRRTDINRTGQVFAVVCSTKFHDPPAPAEVTLPSRPDGMTATRLREPTVAVCDWTTPFAAADIAETAGVVPSSILREICRRAGFTFMPER